MLWLLACILHIVFCGYLGGSRWPDSLLSHCTWATMAWLHHVDLLPWGWASILLALSKLSGVRLHAGDAHQPAEPSFRRPRGRPGSCGVWLGISVLARSLQAYPNACSFTGGGVEAALLASLIAQEASLPHTKLALIHS